MAKQFQLRRGTTEQHANFTGAQGEVTFDTVLRTLVAHDGETPGGQVMISIDLLITLLKAVNNMHGWTCQDECSVLDFGEM